MSNEWIWCMEYCRGIGVNPANEYFWEKAKIEYRKLRGEE